MATPNQNLKSVFDHLGLSNIEVARALHYDASLISRYLSGQRRLKATSPQLDAIANLVLTRSVRVSDVDWLRDRFVEAGLPIDMLTVHRHKQNLIMWLASDGDVLRSRMGGQQITPDEGNGSQRPDKVGALRIGSLQIAMELEGALGGLPRGAWVNLFLSSDLIDTIVCADIAELLMAMVERNDLHIRMVVCVTASTQAMSQILNVYMSTLVSGHVELSVVHGVTQAVTHQMQLILPNDYALLVTETDARPPHAVATAVRDADFVCDMQNSFTAALHYAQPILSLYGDQFTRNVIEVFHIEFCTPGALDVIKDNLNPLFMNEEEYYRFLRTRGHNDAELHWRSVEYHNFKLGLHQNLDGGVAFREILSLRRLNEIARAGQCRMAGNFFMENGFVELDARGCADLLAGYIRYVEAYPNYRLLILDDFDVLHACSCWHIKQNQHISINYWSGTEPVMVYSDQLMLLREFQTHFDKLWSAGEDGIGNQGNVIAILRDVIRRLRAAHLDGIA